MSDYDDASAQDDPARKGGSRPAGKGGSRPAARTLAGLNYFSADIVGANLLGTAFTFPSPASITNYDARPLYVQTSVEPVGTVDTLFVRVSEVGPNSFALPSTTALPVVLEVSFRGTPAGIPTTAPGVPSLTSMGGPLQLSLSVVPSPGNAWGGPNPANASKVTLDIVPAQQPTFNATPVGYVIVRSDQGSDIGTFQLRWIENPVELNNSPGTAELIPNNPTLGIIGPFGIQTP